jgi:hypothetical protein
VVHDHLQTALPSDRKSKRSFFMKSRLYGLVTLLATVAMTSVALADRTHLVRPASECALKPASGVGATPGSIVWGTHLINNTGATQYMQCPMPMDSTGYPFVFAAINVSPGWATTSSCQACVGASDGGVWCYAPSYVSHPSTYRDSVVWDGTTGNPAANAGYADSVELQCALPNGQQARDFYQDSYLITY